jgi:hypothetical protein
VAPEPTDEGITRITGTVSAVEAPLLSRLGKRPCVYWDIRDGLDDDPRERETRSFWLEDETGRVLVIGDHLEVDARAERRRQLRAVAEADIATLSERLREVKAKLRVVQGTGAAELNRERERLALVATFLHATRAHARGKVHLGGSARAQAKWIREHGEIATAGPGAATATMTVDAWEVVIEEGQRVTVEGPCRTEALSADLGHSDGYRSRLTGRVLRGSPGAPLRVTGVGAIAPQERDARPTPLPRGVPQPPRGARMKLALALLLLVAIVVFAAVAGGPR